MESKNFSIFLTQLVPQILERLMKDETMSAHQLIHKFYQSRFYAQLADQSSGLWQYSHLILAQMYREAEKTDGFTYPEEMT